jgi:hypothetical protein
MKYIFYLLLLFFHFNVYSQTYSGPESAEYDFANQRWLISNTTSHRVIARDNNGVLSYLGSSLLSGPYGIEIVGDTLFCCCGSTVKGLLLSDGSQVFSVNTGASFLNGITHDNAGNLYVTDFSGKAIYKVNIALQSSVSIASSLVQSPNGIVYDSLNNRCVFVNWGSNAPVKAIDLTTNVVSTITTTTLGNCDGITRDAGGRYYISTWNLQGVVRYDSSFVSAPVTVVSSLSNPADIFYNILSDTLAVPNASSNTVTFHNFSTVSINANELPVTLFSYNEMLNLLFIKMDKPSDCLVTVYDINGKKCLETMHSDVDITIDLQNFKSGTYIVRIENGNSAIFQKQFVKID